MANTAANVRVGATGKIYGGGTTLPTNATTAPTGFSDYGYVSDAGVTLSVGRTTTDIKAWGGDVVRTVTSEHKVTFNLEFLETSALTLKAWTGDASATATAAVLKNVAGLRQKWIIDVIDADDTYRLVIPDGQITETGDLPFATEEAIKYPVTVTCYPDVTDVKAYIYVDAD